MKKFAFGYIIDFFNTKSSLDITINGFYFLVPIISRTDLVSYLSMRINANLWANLSD